MNKSSFSGLGNLGNQSLVGVGHMVEKEAECEVGLSGLQESIAGLAGVDEKIRESTQLTASFRALQKPGKISQSGNPDEEWNDVFKWLEWEDDSTFNKDRHRSVLSELNFGFSRPNSESQILHSDGNDIEDTEQTLENESKPAALSNEDTNILLDMIFLDQSRNTSNFHYTTLQHESLCNLASLENAQEQTTAAPILKINPQPSKYGEQRAPNKLTEPSNNSSPTGHPPSTQRIHNEHQTRQNVSSLPSQNPTIQAGPPFICTHNACRRSYSRLAELQRHQRVHSGNRAFLCRFTGCRRAGHGFVRKDHLGQHLRRVHGVVA